VTARLKGRQIGDKGHLPYESHTDSAKRVTVTLVVTSYNVVRSAGRGKCK
jgi:hypothetical protein